MRARDEINKFAILPGLTLRLRACVTLCLRASWLANKFAILPALTGTSLPSAVLTFDFCLLHLRSLRRFVAPPRPFCSLLRRFMAGLVSVLFPFVSVYGRLYVGFVPLFSPPFTALKCTTPCQQAVYARRLPRNRPQRQKFAQRIAPPPLGRRTSLDTFLDILRTAQDTNGTQSGPASGPRSNA